MDTNMDALREEFIRQQLAEGKSMQEITTMLQGSGALHDEYVQLQLAEELDNVDMSLSTALARCNRLQEIIDELFAYDITAWSQEIDLILNDPRIHYCGGGLYKPRNPHNPHQ